MHTYEADFAAWSEEQAIALRDHRGDQIDWEHLAEEIEGLSASERRALRSQIRRLIMHLLKWQFQPERRSGSWVDTIENAREEIEDLLKDNPSLRTRTVEFVGDMYHRSVRDAATQTGISKKDFPKECPFTFDELMTFPVSIDETP